MIKIRDAVTYVDEHRVEHQAIVNEVWGKAEPCLINVVYVSADVRQEDAYGRQIMRATSVSHESQVGEARARYWKR